MVSIATAHARALPRALFVTIFGIVSARAASSGELTAQKLGRLMAEVPTVGDGRTVRLSGDGRWIVYEVTRRSVKDNQSTVEMWLQRLPRGAKALPAPVRLSKKASSARWRPGNNTLSVLLSGGSESEEAASRFAFYDVAKERLEPLVVNFSGTAIGGSSPTNIAISENYEWSPGGKFIAFTVPVKCAKSLGLDPRKGVALEYWPHEYWNVSEGNFQWLSSLYVADLRSGQITQRTPQCVSVTGFAWSPDERSVAVSVDSRPNSLGTETDLIIVDRETGQISELVTRPGLDDTPNWSPDGKWIAFSTQHGTPDYFRGWPAIVAVESGQILTLASAPKGVPFRWDPDSKGLLVGGPRNLAPALMRADLRTRTVSAPLPLPSDHITLPFDTHRTLTDDGREMAYVRSGFSSPPEVFITSLDAKGVPRGTPRQITSLSSGFPLRDRVRTELVRWPSRDGKFDIHGLLITPSDAWANGRLERPLPTVLSLTGGPSMVYRSFAADGWRGLELAAAARGYAVLIPNTRGREGYSDAFMFGIRDSKSYLAVPLQDALAGIDFLIERGIADAGRLGICGHSYGGALAAYAITQTDRFRATVVHEGVLDIGHLLYPPEPESWQEVLARDFQGVHDPLDPDERAGILAQSPLFNAHRVRTPTLLQYGAYTSAADAQRFVSILRGLKVPSAFFVYDEGHVFKRPAAIADDITRSLEWLDHWVRDVPYPDAQRAKEYESFKPSRTAGLAHSE